MVFQIVIVEYGDWFDYVVGMDKEMEKGDLDIHLVYFEDLKEVSLIFFIIFIVLYCIVNNKIIVLYCIVLYSVASGSEITPCNKIDKPLVVYRFSAKVMIAY